jgi:hypothetical protein
MWIILVFILTVQMAALNVMGHASFHYAPYGQKLEQQHSSSCPSVQEQYIPAVTGFIQPIGPIATSPCDIANSYAYDNCINITDPYGTLLHQQLPILPNLSVMGQIVPAAADASSSTANSAEYSSDKNPELALLSHCRSSAAPPSQSSPHPLGHRPPNPA